ncbi:hypothetical protein [Aurantiacibacter suaedae]|uniref:hypothetical protein n=1 Tax=Aurantiacibacter suaedae TaxID=2545755 RepID=UPI0010F4D3A1|nr:hypothetical protein [Aurantiacibacter suaedae]
MDANVIIASALLALGGPVPEIQPAMAGDPLVTATAQAEVDSCSGVMTRMFAWWNVQMADGIPFEQAGFARFFTDDAVLRIDGGVVAEGLPALLTHFQRIQNSGAQVEIALPFVECSEAGQREYTMHVIRSRRDGVPRCLLAAGHADLRDGLITEISLVRTQIEPGSSPVADLCWRK